MSSNIRVQRICNHCGKEFTARTTVTQYCSDFCSKRAYKARIKNQKINESNKETKQVKIDLQDKINGRVFLSISEAAQLLGISRRTIYRLIEKGLFTIGKAGKRTILRRSDLEQSVFNSIGYEEEIQPITQPIKISDCYTISEVQKKFRVSESALNRIIKRNNVPKIRNGWYSYVPKKVIENLLR